MLLMNTRSPLFFSFAEIPILSQLNIGLQEQVKNYIEGVCLYTWLKHRFWRNITNYKNSVLKKRRRRKAWELGNHTTNSIMVVKWKKNQKKNTPKKGKEIKIPTQDENGGKERNKKIHTVFHGIRTVTKRTFKNPTSSCPTPTLTHQKSRFHSSNSLRILYIYIYIYTIKIRNRNSSSIFT